MDEMETGFDDFLDAMEADDNQIDEETAQEIGEDQQQTPESDEKMQDEPEEPEADEDPGKPQEPEGKSGEEETFTLKVNKEERTVNREEVISLAQKGADYDRVKEQLTESRTANQQMQAKLDQYANAMDVLDLLAADSGKTLDELAEQLHLSLLMKGGKSEAEARAELRAIKAEAKLSAAQGKEAEQKQAEDESKTRADRELTEFRKYYPDVELTQELCKELMPQVQKGMTLTEAYQNLEIARRDEQIAQLQRQQEAAQQNKINRSSAISSQLDSGGRRSKSDFDDFMSAFE